MEENQTIKSEDQDLATDGRKAPGATKVARIASRYQTVFCQPRHSSWRIRWYSPRNIEQLTDGDGTVLCEYEENICQYLDKLKHYYENNYKNGTK